MKQHGSRRTRRLALVGPLALALTTVLPGTAHANPHADAPKHHVKPTADAPVPPADVPADCSGAPSAPLAVDMNVFSGVKKGLVGTDGLVISTKLTNGVWTSFFDEVSSSTLLGFAENPDTIPVVHCGDVINLAGAKSGGGKGKGKGKGQEATTSTMKVGTFSVGYRALKAEFPPSSVIVLAIVSSDGTVQGFVTLQVTRIRATGIAKYVEGTILSVDFGAAE